MSDASAWAVNYSLANADGGHAGNMEFPIHGFLSDSQLVNASAEIAEAVNYPHIRLFTVGEPKQAQPGQAPLHDLQDVAQPWFVANSSTTAGPGGGAFGAFSAVCWLFGRELSDRLGASIPIGLINNNVGGTLIEKWLPPEDLAACETAGGPTPLPPWAGNQTVVDSRLWSSMITPYTAGPMALSGIAWCKTAALFPLFRTPSVQGIAAAQIKESRMSTALTRS